MIQWVHAGVGVVTLLVLCIFMIVYIGAFSSTTTRICGAPLPGPQGARGERGIQGKALVPGKTGGKSDVPGPDGEVGDTALGILTGPQPLPYSTGLYTGMTGNTGYPGSKPALLDPVNCPPINFKFLNAGVGSELDQYQDTGYFSVTVQSNTGNPSSQTVPVRFVRLGKTVIFQIKQISFNHGGATADWINFVVADFFDIQKRFFVPVTQFATTPYVVAQELIVFDQVPTNFANGLFRLEIKPNGTSIGIITSMRIQFQAQYSPEADEGLYPGTFNDSFNSKFRADTSGTFGTVSEIAITWTLLT